MNLPYFPEAVELFPYASTAIVEETITSIAPGRVRFQASYWFAEVYQANDGVIEPGAIVQVVGRKGITLLVLPLMGKMSLQDLG